ncbi:hypothetical protein GGR51DRAFT_577007 [Nemania sp. FL0031]|nr:hypothetical protein GGR51DRAFT_577007 [Nemania sp. FL0031]
MAEVIRSSSPSPVELYSECITSFAEFVGALTEPDCDVISRDEIQLPRVFEEYGRTKIWGDQSKADLPASARGSLDDTLRDNVDLKSLVGGILESMHIAYRKYDPDQSMDQESISSVSDSDYSTDNEDQPQNRKMPKVCLFFKQITDQVRSLHEISSLLRRPTVTDNVAFRPFDEYHVSEKVIQWRGFRKSLQTVGLPDEAAAPVYDAPLYQEIEEVRWFCQRLARANTRRREQIWYWKSHPYVSKQPIARVILTQEARIRRDTVLSEDQGEDSRSQVSTLTPPDPINAHGEERPLSVFSRLSFSTVSFSDVYDTKTNIRPRTIYAPTALGTDRAIYIPAPPEMIAGQTTFSCPYCGMALDFRDRRRDLWKRHVFRDLRPYICMFEDCQSGEKLFSSRHEWKHHKFQIHRREYVCRRCWSKCTSRTEMSIHLKEHYNEAVSPDQMSILLDLCDRQVDPSSNNTELCVLCGDEVFLSAWHDHVGAHMETLSLFVLPVPEADEDENEGSMNSGKAVDLNNAHNSAVSGVSSLGFSGTQDPSRMPAEIAQMSDSLDLETIKSESDESKLVTSHFRAFKSKDAQGTLQQRINPDGRASVTYNHRARAYEPNAPSPGYTDSSYKLKKTK